MLLLLLLDMLLLLVMWWLLLVLRIVLLRDGIRMNLVLTVWSWLVALWHVGVGRQLSFGDQPLYFFLAASLKL
uniref:Uncharacterized protein n=1 Tax=Anopheles darlingi TaxID=43151 RepID=A0A2M4D0Y4_ANODA